MEQVLSNELLCKLNAICAAYNVFYTDWIDDYMIQDKPSTFIYAKIHKSKGNGFSSLYEDGKQLNRKAGEQTFELYNDEIILFRQTIIEKMKEGILGDKFKEAALNIGNN